ncbi:hypothetical protein [Ornithinibacillus scapharcae]|uniref:hypothetical protein n=1 Tax=Ornithinibacillus scapharcae TaxID=1147159 RepID=UPI000225AA25|nr:hypothetical protein [Ornithinibacillus scapharcae]
MSWKSIEMQVALPRTQDAGKIQEQLFKQNQHFQEGLAQSNLVQEMEKRKKVQEFDEIHLQKDGQKEEKGSGQRGNRKNEKDSNEVEHIIKHPFLGNNFDIRS